MHKKENYHDFGPLMHAIYRYRKFDIYKDFGLSLTEFLSLPRSIVEMVYDVVAVHNKDSSKEIANVLNDIRMGKNK